MKYLIMFFTGLLTLSACQNEDNEAILIHKIPEDVGKYESYELCDNGDCEYTFVQDATLELDEQEYWTYVNIIGGENMVFSFQYDYHDVLEIADDELTEYVYFEVSEEQMSKIGETDFSAFSLSAEEANAYFGFICYCAHGPFLNISEGTIEGQQLAANLWSIDVNVVIDHEDYTPKREIRYSAIYQPQ